QKKSAFVCLAVMLALALMEIAAASLIVLLAGKLTGAAAQDGLAMLALVTLAVFLIKGGVALLDSYMQSRWIQDVVVAFKQRAMERYTKMDYARQIQGNSGHALALLNN